MANNGSVFRIPGFGETVISPTATLQAMSVGDLCYWDGSAARPMSYYTGSGTAILDQEYMSRNFLGVAMQAHLAAETATGHPASPESGLEFATDGIFEFTVASGTFAIGDLVGIVSAAGGVAGDISDQAVVGVAKKDLAIGYVAERYATATTKIRVRLFGRNQQFAGPKFFALGLGGRQPMASSTLADSAVTLTVASNMIQVGVPTAARTVTLPAEANSQGRVFIIVNNSAGANTITVQNSATTSIASVAQNKRAIVFCDGTTWFNITGA